LSSPLVSGVIVRAERPEDYDAIADVVEAAFGSPSEARLVDAIRASTNYVPELSLVAELDGRIVGHVMISFTALYDGDTERWISQLSPLAVAPDVHRQGIGSALVREVCALADDRGEPLVVLEGSPAYYGRFGFESCAAYDIHINLPSWAPPEAAQVLPLRNYEPSIRGHVVYPPAFDGVTDRH
jgi:putative acetyltransferase